MVMMVIMVIIIIIGIVIIVIVDILLLLLPVAFTNDLADAVLLPPQVQAPTARGLPARARLPPQLRGLLPPLLAPSRRRPGRAVV